MIYVSSSWKNRTRVRAVVEDLRKRGYGVYDFTDGKRRQHEEIPPEKFPEQFDPTKHKYREYLNRKEWRDAVVENRQALDTTVVVVLLLPCGIDAHADWAYALGKGACSVVAGHPNGGERSPVHLWADVLIEEDAEIPAALEALARVGRFSAR